MWLMMERGRPVCVAGYFNPFLAYGLEKLVDDVRAAGGDGFIVVDLPPEEGRCATPHTHACPFISLLVHAQTAEAHNPWGTGGI